MIPQHSRIVRVTGKGGGSGNTHGYEVAFGIPWTEHSFISEALRRGHPSNIFDGLSHGIVQAVEANCCWKSEVVIISG